MAGAGKKTFTAGETLTASDVNTYLMEQSVMNFAGTAARASAIPTPTDGMTTYRQDIDALEVYNGSAYIPVNKNVVSYIRNTTAGLTLTTSTETGFMSSPAFTPIAGRLYEITVTIGGIQKTGTTNQVEVRLRKDNTSGTQLDSGLWGSLVAGGSFPYSRTVLLGSAEMGTTSFVPFVSVVTFGNGCNVTNTSTSPGAIIIKDIGSL